VNQCSFESAGEGRARGTSPSARIPAASWSAGRRSCAPPDFRVSGRWPTTSSIWGTSMDAPPC